MSANLWMAGTFDGTPRKEARRGACRLPFFRTGRAVATENSHLSNGEKPIRRRDSGSRPEKYVHLGNRKKYYQYCM